MTDPQPIRRMRYFDHEFLVADDFNDEQAYHIRMRRLHNSTLHTAGVAPGLQLSAAAGATSVTVSDGVAVDANGQEIVLLRPTSVDLSGNTGTVFITIAY